MATVETLEALNNKELRAKCQEYGLPNVPVTDTSRALLIRRLHAAITGISPKPPKNTRRQTVAAEKVAPKAVPPRTNSRSPARVNINNNRNTNNSNNNNKKRQTIATSLVTHVLDETPPTVVSPPSSSFRGQANSTLLDPPPSSYVTTAPNIIHHYVAPPAKPRSERSVSLSTSEIFTTSYTRETTPSQQSDESFDEEEEEEEEQYEVPEKPFVRPTIYERPLYSSAQTSAPRAPLAEEPLLTKRHFYTTTKAEATPSYTPAPAGGARYTLGYSPADTTRPTPPRRSVQFVEPPAPKNKLYPNLADMQPTRPLQYTLPPRYGGADSVDADNSDVDVTEVSEDDEIVSQATQFQKFSETLDTLKKSRPFAYAGGTRIQARRGIAERDTAFGRLWNGCARVEWRSYLKEMFFLFVIVVLAFFVYTFWQ